MSDNESNCVPIKGEDGIPDPAIKHDPHTHTTASVVEQMKSEPTHMHSSSDDNNSGSDSDSDEEFYKPPEPLYDRANSLKFRQLCHRFETMWKQKSKKKKPSKGELLGYLLSKQLRKHLDGSASDSNGSSENDSGSGNNNSSSSNNNNNNSKRYQSIFPMLRLVVPDKDSTRPRLWMKERVIADTWATALGLSKQGSDYKKLVKYNDPTAAGDRKSVV